jgi:hypothetical protein
MLVRHYRLKCEPLCTRVTTWNVAMLRQLFSPRVRRFPQIGRGDLAACRGRSRHAASELGNSGSGFRKRQLKPRIGVHPRVRNK